MQVLKRGFAFYVFGNIHVGLAAYSLTKITLLLFDMNNQNLANFVFFSTVLSYNFIRFFQIEKINSMIAIWIRANKKSLIVLNGIALTGSVFCLFNFKLDEILVLIPFLMATLFYVFPFKNKFTGLRNIPGLKLLLIGITWTGLTAYLPLVSAHITDSQQMYFFVIQRFLFVLAITIPFDIRDAQFDLPELNTLPQVMGVNKAKIIALVALLLVIFSDLLMYQKDAKYFMINLFIVILSMIMIAFSGTKRQRYYTTFWIEAIPILWYLLYLVFVK